MKYTQTFAEAYRQVKLKQALSEDHEVSMAISQLKTIQDNLNQAMAILQTKGADYDMEAWVQSKITSANDKMTSVADYMKNTPSVDEAVVDKRFKNDERDGDKPKVEPKGAEVDASVGEIATLKAEIEKLKLELDNEKNKAVKPEPHPDTGEVPLRTGVAAALLDKKGPKPNVEKQAKTKVELSKKKSKIEINPDVEMGVFSGGNKMNQGNLY